MVNIVALPAVAVLVKTYPNTSQESSASTTKFCVISELFVMPVPLIVNLNVGAAVIVNALALGLNTMPFTSVLAERETPIVFEAANVAVSDGPLGMVGGVQFAA